ncbi:General alpha-glucoside permease [Lachnellula subtilissima]|uniref:General alpha-glucoside permease n=1 Tax=Lachnellula subtilissima TaxID=602034 RepID=A0A8H8RRV5_9HELO|nr:General alpha-glucoside permease [Lachnellula subtilissima]
MSEDDRSPQRRSSAELPQSKPSLETPATERVSRPINEESPLLSASDEEEEGPLMEDPASLDDDQHKYSHEQESKGLWYMVLLTISIGGLQLAWAVEISNGTPYLLSLGMSKSLMALVWIAGPLSGALVQPYVGMLSDNCRSKWGKRVPFMAVGAAATIISLLALAWVREIVGGILGLFGADRESNGVRTTIIIVAVLFVYLLDFAINTVQAGIRAFILDCCPSHQQETANAMASRITGMGSIVGYVAGYLDLPKYVWFFGNTQFKVLSVIACIALGSTVALSIGTVHERDASLEDPPTKGKSGLVAFFKQVFHSIRRLPPQTRKVCEVQFFAWIGFFPQLFYSSSYVGDIYVQPYLEANPNMTPVEIDHLYAKATRVGTFALLIYAIVSLSTNMLLPFIVAPSYDQPRLSSRASQKSYSTRTSRILDKFVIPWLTLRRAWLLSHCVFAACMFSTLLVRSTGGATAIIGIVGIPWALTLWAPFAIISAEVSKRDALRRSRGNTIKESEEDQAGIILGIHNMSIASPQIIATIGSSIIFKFLQKPRGVPGDRSITVVLAAGGLSTLVAAFLTSRIRDEVEIPAEGVLEEGAGGDREERDRMIVRSGSFGGLEY